MRVWVWARGATYVLLLLRALLAVVGIGDARLATDDAATLIGAVVALVADTHEDARPHVGVADGALAVALFAQAANRCKARDMGGSGGRRRHMHFASAFEGAACAQMPGCFRHMIRSGWCFAMANACGEARTLASSRALFSRKASFFARCLDNFTARSLPHLSCFVMPKSGEGAVSVAPPHTES